LAAIVAEPNLYKQWHARAVAGYGRSLINEPMPGIWPKYVARTELAMRLHQSIEEGDRSVPVAFRSPSAQAAIDGIDFYAVAQALLSDSLISELDARKPVKRPRR
jgi:hypothetical protein